MLFIRRGTYIIPVNQPAVFHIDCFKTDIAFGRLISHQVKGIIGGDLVERAESRLVVAEFPHPFLNQVIKSPDL